MALRTLVSSMSSRGAPRFTYLSNTCTTTHSGHRNVASAKWVVGERLRSCSFFCWVS
jgi:hypothetical protein